MSSKQVNQVMTVNQSHQEVVHDTERVEHLAESVAEASFAPDFAAIRYHA